MNPPPDAAVSRAVLALSLAAFGSGTSQRVMDAMLPGLAGEFGRPLGVVAAAVTAFTFAYAMGQLLFGPAGERHGKVQVACLRWC